VAFLHQDPKVQAAVESHRFATRRSTRTLAQIPLAYVRTRTDIKLKHVHRQANGRTRIRDIDNARNVALDGDAAEHQIDLVVIIAVPLQIFDDPEATLAVRDRGVHVVLFAVLVDAEALEVDHAAWGELRLHGARDVDWGLAAFHAELLLAAFKDVEFDRYDPRDLDCAAERDLAVALWSWKISGLAMFFGWGKGRRRGRLS
jgi:hypothetical protein